MMDLYGRGYSDNPNLPQTDQLRATQVIELMKNRGIKKASIVGLSNGGRIISKIARETDAVPYFPFGPKRYPFYHWATRTGSAWTSPVSLLVHKDVGLMVSYRGALGFQIKLDLPAPGENPCKICDQPCVKACPISALTIEGYNVKKCKQFLTTGETTHKLSQGCLVRHSCPLSKNLRRDPEQSEYHMSEFKAASIK